jgi:hypothetical protein
MGVVRERARRQVVRRAVREIARRVEVADDDLLAPRELLQLGRRVQGQRQLGAARVALLVEARFVGAVRRPLDDRAHLVRARRRPGDRAALAPEGAGRVRGRGAEAVVAGQVGGADAQLPAVAAHLGGTEARVESRPDVAAGSLPGLHPHPARLY